MQGGTAKDRETMAKTIYAEARGESLEGQHAVGHVIMTRAKANKDYWGGNSIHDVCRNEQQFECWNGRKDIEINDPDAYDRIYQWVPDLLNGKIPDPTKGCDHYNNPKKEKEPEYVKKAIRDGKRSIEIGEHVFRDIKD